MTERFTPREYEAMGDTLDAEAEELARKAQIIMDTPNGESPVDPEAS